MVSARVSWLGRGMALSLLLLVGCTLFGCAPRDPLAQLARIHVSYDQYSLFHSAATNNLEAVALLLQAGMTPNVADDKGTTALVAAASRQYHDVSMTLLAAGAAVYAADEDGTTALCYAAKGGDAKLVKALLAKGADLGVVDAKGFSPGAYARFSGNAEVVDLVGKALNVPQGKTPGEVQTFAGMEFVWIPAGTFTMGVDGGDPFDGPAHKVTISRGFWMGRYEVTYEVWERVFPDRPRLGADWAKRPAEEFSRIDVAALLRYFNSGPEKGFALPSEAEWEYACRAGTTTKYSFGDDPALLPEYAWFLANTNGLTSHPVGQLKPNPWGLYDMHGNVAEWCNAYVYDYRGEPVTDPLGPLKDKVHEYAARGGAYWADEVSCTSHSRRYVAHVDFRANGIGIRLVRYP